MKLPLNIAEKLILLVKGDKIPASKLKHAIVQELISEGILHKPGKIKSTIQIADNQQLILYLKNHFAIDDLSTYIETCKKEELTRADLVLVSADSKLRAVRTFKGFLVNSYSSIQVTLKKEPFTISPKAGTFQFIYDFETFIIPPDITVIGIENPENFRHIDKQKYLFNVGSKNSFF